MAKQQSVAVRGKWVLAIEDGKPTLLPDRWVLIEGGVITAVVKDRPGGVDRIVEGGDRLVLPGFINMHNHAVSALIIRGLTDELPNRTYASDLVYGLLMPLGDMVVEILSPAEIRAAIELGLLEIVKGGTTTLMEVFREGQIATFDLAREMGFRLYGAPYLFSAAKLDIGPDGKPTYTGSNDGGAVLERVTAMFRQHDGSADGRIRVAFGPHGCDSCEPDLLRAIRKRINELGCLATIHLSQSQFENDLLKQRHGRSPTEYLDWVGLLGPDLIVAHCIYTSDADLDLLKRSDTTIASCPLTFARGGVTAPVERFIDRGIRTTFGTDGYCMDIVGEIRAAGTIAKLHSGRSDAISARQLIDAVTLDGAKALKRDDLGRIAPGARGDLTVIDLSKPRFQPVSDPLRCFVWAGNGEDVAAVIVEGEVLVENGRYLRGDETRIVSEGAAAIAKVWDRARATGLLARAG